MPLGLFFLIIGVLSKLDVDSENGCIRDYEHAYSREGGLAVLHGNLAEDARIVKTTGVDESILVFSGPARGR